MVLMINTLRLPDQTDDDHPQIRMAHGLLTFTSARMTAAPHLVSERNIYTLGIKGNKHKQTKQLFKFFFLHPAQTRAKQTNIQV